MMADTIIPSLTPEMLLPSVPIECESGVALVDALVAAGLARSKSEARRLIEQGGVVVDGVREKDARRELTRPAFAFATFVLRRGKQQVALVQLVPPGDDWIALNERIVAWGMDDAGRVTVRKGQHGLWLQRS